MTAVAVFVKLVLGALVLGFIGVCLLILVVKVLLHIFRGGV